MDTLDPLSQTYQLDKKQLEQFAQYLSLLQSWNKRMNLTAITDPAQIVLNHFDDSLRLTKCMDVAKVQSIADIGTGAGFPGLALKIMFPHLRLMLIEVNQKKIKFLHMIADTLGLDEVYTSDLDWRTFLRSTDYDIELFVSRAALQPTELVRMFKPSCHYNNDKLVYWASQQWQPAGKEAAFITKECPYQLDGKQRKLVFFAR